MSKIMPKQIAPDGSGGLYVLDAYDNLWRYFFSANIADRWHLVELPEEPEENNQ